MNTRKHFLIIPCFNEALRLKIQPIRNFLLANPYVTICFVNDGSTDNTGDILNLIHDHYPAQALVINHGVNCGKAEAVRTGVLTALKLSDVSSIGFLDADLSTGLDEYAIIMNTFIEGKGTHLALGVRKSNRDSQIHYSPFRRLMASIARLALLKATPVKISDTQCGAKIFSVRAASVAFEKKFISRWLFDVEIFLRLNDFSIAQESNAIVEVYLKKWKHVTGSKLKMVDIFIKIPYEFMLIILNYHSPFLIKEKREKLVSKPRELNIS